MFFLIAVAVGTVDVLSLMTVYRWQGSVNSVGNTGFGILLSLVFLLFVKYALHVQTPALWIEYTLRFIVVSLYAGTSLIAFYLGDALPDLIERRSHRLAIAPDQARQRLQQSLIEATALQRSQVRLSINAYSDLIDAEERKGGCGTKCKQFKPRLQVARDELVEIKDTYIIPELPRIQPFSDLEPGKRDSLNAAMANSEVALFAAGQALEGRRALVKSAKPRALTDTDVPAETREKLRKDLADIVAKLPSSPTQVTFDRLGTADEVPMGPAQLISYAGTKLYVVTPLALLYLDLFTAWLARREAKRRRPAVAGKAEEFADWCIRVGHRRASGASVLMAALGHGPEVPVSRFRRWLAGPGLPPLVLPRESAPGNLLLSHVLPLLREYAEESLGNLDYFSPLVKVGDDTCSLDRALLPFLRHPKVTQALFTDDQVVGPQRPRARQGPKSALPDPLAGPPLLDLEEVAQVNRTDDQNLEIAQQLDRMPLALQRSHASVVVGFHLMAARQASHAARLGQVRKHLAALRHLGESDPEIRHTFGPDLLEASIVEGNARGDLLQFESAANELTAIVNNSNRENAGTSWFKAASSIGHLWLLGGRPDKASTHLSRAIRGLVGSERIQPLIHRMDATVRAGRLEDSFHRDLVEVRRLLKYNEPSARRAADSHRFLQLLLCRAAATRPHWLPAAEFDSEQAESRLCREEDCHYAAELTGFYLAHAHIQRGRVPEALRVARQLAEHLLELLRAPGDEGSPLNLIDVMRLGMLCGVIALVKRPAPAEAGDLRSAARTIRGPHQRAGAIADTEQRQLAEVWQSLQAWLSSEAAGDDAALHQIINRTGYLWWPES